MKITAHGEDPTPIDSFVDLVRRLHVPGYEEARPHFGDSGVVNEFGGAAESLPYTAHALMRIPTLGDAD